MPKSKMNEVVKIISPTDGVAIYYDLHSYSIRSFEYTKKNEGGTDNEGTNNSEENTDEQVGAERIRTEKLEDIEAEAQAETPKEIESIEPDSETIFSENEKSNEFLNNW
jgi:hypothetical protein